MTDREANRRNLLRRKAIAKEYVDKLRASTVCADCGKQPIEWHREEHAQGKYNYRVAGLVQRGYPVERIQEEIDASTALCRSCHMRRDGRIEALKEARPFKKGDTQPPKPCAECGRLYKPLARGLCRKCYDKKHHAGQLENTKAYKSKESES